MPLRNPVLAPRPAIFSVLPSFMAIGVTVAATVAALHAQRANADPAPAAYPREHIEWCDIWFTDGDHTDLPRVLLIGDSITRGYYDGVEKQLDGKAACGRLCTSRSVGDPVFFDELALVLKQYDFAVIHFNNGLHGWGYTEDQYRAGFAKLLDALQSAQPRAKLICATTTPVQGKAEDAYHADRVPARNAIAAELCAARHIPLDNLHALVKDHPDWHGPDGVHFNDEGRGKQAGQVAKLIGAQLKPAH